MGFYAGHAKMPGSKDLTPTMRARLCELRDIGWSYRKIHQKYPEIPLSTIHYTIKQQNQRDNQKSSPRSGRPKAMSTEEQKRLLDLAEEDNHIKMRELSQAVQSSPSIRTVQRLFRALHMKKWKQCERPEITPENAE